MLEYAASRRQIASRPSSPNAMLVIISVHVALLAAVISAKMDLPARIMNKPITVDFPKDPPPPPPNIAQPRTPTQAQRTVIDQPPKIVQIKVPALQPVDIGPPTSALSSATGGNSISPVIPQPPVTAPIRHEALLLTPPWELKPPYPATKLASEEEATLTLRLTIDEHGRVIAVDSVGPADRAFLDSARRYIIAHWRYAAATVDGRATASNLTVTLRFQLDG